MENTRPRSRLTEEDRLSRMQSILDDTNAIVKDLQEKFTTYTAKPTSGRPKSPHVRFCQSLVRKVVQALSDDADDPLELEYESFDDCKVQGAKDRVVREIMLNYSGKPWANIETLSEAFKQVWKNKRDDNHRQITGKKEQHRINNRRNKRRTSKLKDRAKALEKSKRPDDWRRRAKGILTRECTYPDISDEDDETVKLVLPLVWESPMMTDIKEQLDIIRGKDMRQDHPSKMLRDSPSGRVPEWAIRGRYKEQRGNNLISRRKISSTPESSPPSTPSTSSRATASSATFFSTPSDTSCQPDAPSTPSSTSSSSTPPSTPLSTPTSRPFCDLSPVHKSKRRRSF